MKILPSINNDLFPLLRILIPLVLTGIAQSSTFFFQTMFLAHVSDEALAASALASWLYATLVVISFGTMSSINVLVAHKHGAGDDEGISLVVRDGIVLAIIVAIPSFIFLWNAAPLFLLFGQQTSVTLLAGSFLQPLAWSIFPNLIMVAFLEFIIGIRHARTILVFTLLSVLLIISCNYIFIFGGLGLPAFGIAGAGWAMTASYSISVIALISYVLLKKAYRVYCQNILFFRGKTFLGELIKIGIPMGVMYCFEVGFFLALTLLMGLLGKHWLAANQITMQYMCALMGVIFSIAQAITVRMSYLLGKEDGDAAIRTAYFGIAITVALMFVVAILYWSIPDKLIAIDLDMANPSNKIIIQNIKALLVVAAFFQLFEATRIALFGALRALKDTRFTMVISILSFWGIAIPVGYFLAKPLHMNGVGFWCGMLVGAVFSTFVLGLRFKYKIKTVVTA